MNKILIRQRGSTLVITIAVVATILALLGSAISYTQHVSRLADRSRKTAQAMEIADGHLEYLFTNWRNIYRKTWTTVTLGATDASLVGTSYFYTDLYKPGVGCTYNGGSCAAPTPIPNMSPSATPSIIGLPTPGANFPSRSDYSVTQFRIQAVDPMITLSTDGNERAWLEDQTAKGKGSKIQANTSTPPSGWAEMDPAAVPPAAYGPNAWQYSFYYLAAVDVSVPAMTGNVTAKVRRVFEKKFDNPWTYAMFFVDDLEFSPSAAFTISGPIHTDGSLYISTSNFTAGSSVAYSGEYVNGYSPNDTSSHSGGITTPNFATGLPPVQQAAFLPFGWDVTMSTADANSNNDSYHDLIEPPAAGTDALANIRLYNQADYRILIDSSNNITITDSTGAAIVNSGSTKNTYQAITGAITTDRAIQDQREGTPVRLVTVDVGTLTTAINGGNLKNASGNASTIFYIKDTTTNGTSVSSKIGGTGSSVNTTERAIRLTNGAVLPSGGLTIASENPIYIQGNYNTGSGTVPSNSGTYTDPDASGYTRKAAAVIGDAITILSNAWIDTNSTSSISSRTASNTTVNAALVGGVTPSSGGNYSGGGENFIRYLEDWKSNTFCYYGSMVELFSSATAIGAWTGAGNTYKAPLTSKWFYDDATFSTGSPPGKLQIAAYLQQQRWYQVY
jgi:hypothetical protein